MTREHRLDASNLVKSEMFSRFVTQVGVDTGLTQSFFLQPVAVCVCARARFSPLYGAK